MEKRKNPDGIEEKVPSWYGFVENDLGRIQTK
jgi:hypothetical protein